MGSIRPTARPIRRAGGYRETMVEFGLDGRTGGAALVVGYLLLLGLVLANPAGGPSVTASPRALVFLLVLPVLGLVAGVYAVYGGPFGGFGLFLAASYLGLFGVSLTLGLFGAPAVVTAVGAVAFVASAVALVVSAKAVVGFFRIVPGADPENGE